MLQPSSVLIEENLHKGLKPYIPEAFTNLQLEYSIPVTGEQRSYGTANIVLHIIHKWNLLSSLTSPLQISSIVMLVMSN